jgi:CopG family transcriptional regulator/antitoxin EndoAI
MAATYWWGRGIVNVRLNITLPESTVRLLDKAASRGKRSSLIDEAVRSYLKRASRTKLHKELAEGYRRDADLDLKIAEEWFPIDEEAWEKSEA